MSGQDSNEYAVNTKCKIFYVTDFYSCDSCGYDESYPSSESENSDYFDSEYENDYSKWLEALEDDDSSFGDLSSDDC